MDEAALQIALQRLKPAARAALRRVLVADQASRNDVASALLRILGAGSESHPDVLAGVLPRGKPAAWTAILTLVLCIVTGAYAYLAAGWLELPKEVAEAALRVAEANVQVEFSLEYETTGGRCWLRLTCLGATVYVHRLVVGNAHQAPRGE